MEERGFGGNRSSGGELAVEFQISPQSVGYFRLQGFMDQGYDRSFLINLESNGMNKHATINSISNRWYADRNNYLFNLGYKENWGEKDSRCTVMFPLEGEFQLEDIQVWAIQMEKYPMQVEKLREEPFENIEFGTDSVKGTVDLSQDKILCLSFPYSKGWSVEVDGMPVEILRGNIMFMALPLKAGEHVIEFTYHSPGRRAGIIISLFSMCIVIIKFQVKKAYMEG